MEHACELNTGGIQKPIHLAILKAEKGKVSASKLDLDSLAEHENMIKEATAHLRGFRDVLEGSQAAEIPKAPAPASASPKTGDKIGAGKILPGSS